VGSVGLPEVLVVLVVALIVLGPKRLPDAARALGKAVAEFRRATSGFQAEVRDTFGELTEPFHHPEPTPGASAVEGSGNGAGAGPVGTDSRPVPHHSDGPADHEGISFS